MSSPKPVLKAELVLPLSGADVCAGFPSPAEDFQDEPVDLNRMLVANPPATFLWRVSGHSMIEAGIHDGDVLVVDRSLEPRHGDVVVAVVMGECSVKRLSLVGGRPLLRMENASMGTFHLPDDAEIEIWGVVTFSLHRLRR